MQTGETFNLRDGEIVKVIGPATLKIIDVFTENKIVLSTYDIERLYAIAFPDRLIKQS